MIVKCIPTQEDKEPCPLIKTCLARLTDGTITGCSLPLWWAGIISKDGIKVEHTISEEEDGEFKTKRCQGRTRSGKNPL